LFFIKFSKDKGGLWISDLGLMESELDDTKVEESGENNKSKDKRVKP
jgi:hypothetical protein